VKRIAEGELLKGNCERGIAKEVLIELVDILRENSHC
jgi:hypothetical protein